MSESPDDGPVFEVNKIAFRIPVSEQVLYDLAPMRDLIDRGLDRMLNPWKFPDRNPMPTFVPSPLLARLQRGLASAQSFPGRIRDAWSVLLGRETVHEPEDGDW